jgi:hypothetical protein
MMTGQTMIDPATVARFERLLALMEYIGENDMSNFNKATAGAFHTITDSVRIIVRHLQEHGQ